MKKLLSVLLIALLLLSCACAGAFAQEAAEGAATEVSTEEVSTEEAAQESPEFDYTVFEGLDGYSYDKFDKTWSYYGAILEQYTDAVLVIGIQAENSTEGAQPVKFYAWIRDEKNPNVLFNVSGLSIMANETLISCQMADTGASSMTLIAPQDADVLKLIAEADELAFKLIHSKGSTTLEPGKDKTADFQAAAKNIYESGLFDYLGTSADWFAENFPITVEQ